MHASRRRERQQQRVQSQAQASDAYALFNLLTSPQLLDKVESLLPEHLFPPTETLAMFLSQALSADRSCRQRAVNEGAIKRVIRGLKPLSTHTGGYCRAPRAAAPRPGLEPHSIRRPEARGGGLALAGLSRASRRWDDDTAANQARYPQPKSQAARLGFPLVRLVGLV